MRVHVLQHVPFEGPGVLSSWAESNDFDLTLSRFYAQKKLPEPDEIDLLVVMGGPMGVQDEDMFGWLADEKYFISRCLERDIKIAGICLGAQLLADVLGARVRPNPEKEIGWFPIEWTEDAVQNPLFDFLPQRQMVLHWHGDTFDIPKGAVNLASSEACINQAFLYGNSVLALQFHLEMTPRGLRQLIGHSQNEFSENHKFVQSPQMLLADNALFEDANRDVYQLLDRFVER